jgi:hypothetical protein
MTERSDSAMIIAGAAEHPAPRSPVKQQAPAIRVGALGVTCLHRRPGRGTL